MSVSDRNDKSHGFRIYNDRWGPLSKSTGQPLAGAHNRSAASATENKQMEIALLQKLHAKTQVIGFLVYSGEIKGIRFFDPVKRKFFDIAPWHLNQFNMSKLKLMGIRQIELLRNEAGESRGTVVVEFLTKHEVAGYFRANRMISEQLAAALSGILNYMPEEEYQNLLKSFANQGSE